ncbi:MAG: ABC transporter ATP-binding protein [Pseudomonadota bacterium]
MQIDLTTVSAGYGKSPDVLRDISLKIPKGAFVTLIGPNGSGKSTLLRVIAAVLRPRSGSATMDGRALSGIPPRQLARRISFLPQQPITPAEFTVRDLVSYGRHPYLGWMGRMQPGDWSVVDWACEMTRLTDLQDRLVGTLSGGERQRAWLALSLAQQSDLLLLDEPTTFLDICYQLEILELVRRLNETLGMSVVMVLHDLNQAARYSHRMLALKDGMLVAEGAPDEVMTPAFLRDVFRIDARLHRDEALNCPVMVPVRSLIEKRNRHG